MKSITDLANRAAEAAKIGQGWAPVIHPQLIEFAQSVIDQLSEGGEDLVTYAEFTDWQHPNHYVQPSGICNRLNTKHRAIVGAKVAQRDAEMVIARREIQTVRENLARAEHNHAACEAEFKATNLHLSEQVIELSRQLAERKHMGGYISSKEPKQELPVPPETQWAEAKDYIGTKITAPVRPSEVGIDLGSEQDVTVESMMQFVPLEACDVPPESVIRQEIRETEMWHKVLLLTPKGVVVTCVDLGQGTIFPQLWTFEMLFNGCAEISRDNGKTWLPAKKPSPLSTQPRIISARKDTL